MRKLAAIEALSRYGKAQGRMVSSITIAPNQWPTHSVIDWVNVFGCVADARARQRLAEAMQIPARAPVVPGHQAHLQHRAGRLLAVADAKRRREHRAPDAGRDGRPTWKDDMGRLANGFISRRISSQAGAWHTTTANLWGPGAENSAPV